MASSDATATEFNATWHENTATRPPGRLADAKGFEMTEGHKPLHENRTILDGVEALIREAMTPKRKARMVAWGILLYVEAMQSRESIAEASPSPDVAVGPDLPQA